MNEQSSSYYTTSEDTYKDPAKLSKEKLPINKSPVLYLRRSRTRYFPANLSNKRYAYMDSGQSSWFVDTGLNLDNINIDENYKVDSGELYPNHSGIGRVGQPEWIKFRDYKRNNLYYTASEEIVID